MKISAVYGKINYLRKKNKPGKEGFIMDYISIPIILIISYIIGEIYKVIFSKKKWCKKMLPIIESITGGIVGVLIYLSNPEEFTIKVNILKK